MLRHAKSSWTDPTQRDIDRPLNDRGQTASALIAQYMSEQNLKPDRILCSTAQRTRQTLQILQDVWHEDSIDLEFHRSLYDDMEETYLPIIRREGKSAQTLMVIAHNNAIHATAMTLLGKDPHDLAEDMAFKYPTGTLSVFSFDIQNWQNLSPRSGALQRFVKPRALAETGAGL
ncbi:MAG: histidine phosphatase family protein [Rhodobacteraceae bacterium]|nr:histidine phosphatase family protein [Paracoccaceae bacterium]